MIGCLLLTTQLGVASAQQAESFVSWLINCWTAASCSRCEVCRELVPAEVEVEEQYRDKVG
jgi:Na+-translocating ferredoxin:NAD+ oxidoreductase RnfC subunit